MDISFVVVEVWKNEPVDGYSSIPTMIIANRNVNQFTIANDNISLQGCWNLHRLFVRNSMNAENGVIQSERLVQAIFSVDQIDEAKA